MCDVCYDVHFININNRASVLESSSLSVSRLLEQHYTLSDGKHNNNINSVVVQHSGHRRQSACLTPRRGGLRFGVANNVAPSRRFCEDRREALKLATKGRRHDTNTLGAPAVAKTTKPGDLCRSKWRAYTECSDPPPPK